MDRRGSIQCGSRARPALARNPRKGEFEGNDNSTITARRDRNKREIVLVVCPLSCQGRLDRTNFMFPRASFFAVFDIVIVPLIRRSLILRRTSLRYLFYLQVPAGTRSTRRKFSLILHSVPSWASLIQMLRNLSRERNGRPKENLSLLVTRVSIDSVTFAETR